MPRMKKKKKKKFEEKCIEKRSVRENRGMPTD